MIDERIKLPISARWNEAAHFRVTVDDAAVIVSANLPPKRACLPDRVSDQLTDGLVPLVEQVRDDLGVAIDAQRQLCEIVGPECPAGKFQVLRKIAASRALNSREGPREFAARHLH